MTSSIRLRLYAARERRWTACTLAIASVICAAAVGLICGCVFGWVWLAVGAAVALVSMWTLMLWSAGRALEWSERLHEEEEWLGRENAKQALEPREPFPCSACEDLLPPIFMGRAAGGMRSETLNPKHERR